MSSKRLAVVLVLAFFAVATQAGDQAYTFTTLAGAPPSLMPVPPLDHPYDVAVDASGNVYIADSYNDTIRKITSQGVVSTLAGSAGVEGTADGNGSAARFNDPERLAVDVAGNIYVADALNDAIRKVTPSGQVTTVAGNKGVAGSADGRGSAAQFDHPRDIAIDPSGAIYVADQFNQTIRKITTSGDVTTLAGKAGA